MARVHKISRRVQNIRISATKLMPMLAARIGGCVSLGQGVPSFPTPPHIAEAVSRALRDEPGIGKYSLQPGMPVLREVIAGRLAEEKGFVVDPGTEVGVTVGAMEALLMTMLTVVDRGDEVIVPSPGYASHAEQVLMAEGVPVYVPLRPADWGLDVEAIRAAVTDRTRAVILCNPGNPTGTVYDEADVRALCALALEQDFVIISDETYDFMVYDAAGNPAPMPFSPASLPEMRDHVICINSFSKKYALTGWRVGYVAADKRWMDELLKVHDAAAICAPTVSQYAALAALTGPQDCVDAMRSALCLRRAQTCAALDGMADHFSYVIPRGAFYVMARYRFSHAASPEVARRILEEARVITIPGGSFGPEGEGHLRLSFGGEQEELAECFSRLGAWVRENA
ncbi:pyridoxal phosphate-dependent aminotransferase [Desulfovibrio psychrotolerans]|uniref:Aminotransferase n=1 Tax=Desulfovibrio psychrotolerans TaxID=415242 RepID=A0A7J0BXB0_9BACT|nr:pyridoxal phosphate-dependent aminotransferase [Desulfovibrio psychrotolerans]GFM37811.1 aminotransferase [Desulfovibrio psychrotolerans]